MADNIDNKGILKKDIIPLVQKIKDICRKSGVPFFFTAVLCENGKETEYYTEMLSPSVANVEVSDDKIAKNISVMGGFDVVPPHEVMEIEI